MINQRPLDGFLFSSRSSLYTIWLFNLDLYSHSHYYCEVLTWLPNNFCKSLQKTYFKIMF